MSKTMRIPILVFMLRQDTKSKIDYVMYLFIPFLSVNGLMSVFLRSLDHYDRSVLYHCQHEAKTWYTLPVESTSVCIHCYMWDNASSIIDSYEDFLREIKDFYIACGHSSVHVLPGHNILSLAIVTYLCDSIHSSSFLASISLPRHKYKACKKKTPENKYMKYCLWGDKDKI